MLLLSLLGKGRAPCFEQNCVINVVLLFRLFSYFINISFVPSLMDVCPVALEKKVNKFRQGIFAMSILFPFGKMSDSHWKKLEFPPPKDALWQAWLKLAEWFVSRRWKYENLIDGKTDDGQQAIRNYRNNRWAKAKNYCDHWFCLFVCLYGDYRPTREFFTHMWRRHPCRRRAANFELCSALMVIEQRGFFNVPHLLRLEPGVYNGHLRGPVIIGDWFQRNNRTWKFEFSRCDNCFWNISTG